MEHRQTQRLMVLRAIRRPFPPHWTIKRIIRDSAHVLGMRTGNFKHLFYGVLFGVRLTAEQKLAMKTQTGGLCHINESSG